MSKFEIQNGEATIYQQNIGDNNTNSYNSSDNDFKEVSEILKKIREILPQIDANNSEKYICEIEDEINKKGGNKKIVAKKLGDLLIGITGGCIANGMPELISKISHIINTLSQ